jgi:hypothetical protein
VIWYFHALSWEKVKGQGHSRSSIHIDSVIFAMPYVRERSRTRSQVQIYILWYFYSTMFKKGQGQGHSRSNIHTVVFSWRVFLLLFVQCSDNFSTAKSFKLFTDIIIKPFTGLQLQFPTMINMFNYWELHEKI